jgi:DNA replication protein DnaC
MYKRLSRLLEELEIAYADGSLAKLRMKIAKIDLLILDDWALSPITARGRQELLEIIDDRIGSGSILITSQLPVDNWHEYIGEPTIADAILDRLVHRAHRIELRGDNMRKIHDEKVIDAGKV